MAYPTAPPTQGIINNTYAYPNANSYSSFGREGSTLLLHGFISSMTTTQDGTHTSSNTLVKKFQFNPPNEQFLLQMVDQDPLPTIAQGGNDTSGGVGMAKTDLVLNFNREIEVAKAESGEYTTPAYFKEIGVQKDVLDVYRIMLGPDTPSPIGSSDAGGINNMLGEIFDSGVAGALIHMKPIIVSFNPSLTWFGRVGGFVYTFEKFNSRMVPTIVGMTISIDIWNITTKSAIQQQQLAATAPHPSAGSGTGGGLTTGASTSVPNSGPSTPQGPGGQLPPPYISSGGIHWGS